MTTGQGMVAQRLGPSDDAAVLGEDGGDGRVGRKGVWHLGYRWVG